jgi:hypothetical protein
MARHCLQHVAGVTGAGYQDVQSRAIVPLMEVRGRGAQVHLRMGVSLIIRPALQLEKYNITGRS